MTPGVCPYCRAPIAPEEEQATCSGCGTIHHKDCYEENGGCTIFGCSCAPAEEPKLSVSGPDLQGVAAPAQMVTTPRKPTVPPPPPQIDPNAPPLASAAAAAPSPFGGSVVPSILGLSSGDAIIPEPVSALPPKSRTTYIVLGALLGALGAHSFYAGYKKRGGIQLAITVLTLGFGSPMSWIWAIIDVCTIGEDSRGVQFES